MAKTLLVSVDLDSGLAVVQALDAAKIRLNVAMWAKLEEYSDWRLILASRQLDAEGFLALRSALDAAGITVWKKPDIMLMRMKDPFIRDLRRAFAKEKNVEGMRLGGQMFGDKYVEDGYVYRIS
jgi:predicted lipid carrier protein YhbT